MCLSKYKTVDDLRELANSLERASYKTEREELIRIGHLVKRCFLHLAHVTDSASPAQALSLASEFIDWDALMHSLMDEEPTEPGCDDALYDPETNEHFDVEPEPERP